MTDREYIKTRFSRKICGLSENNDQRSMEETETESNAI